MNKFWMVLADNSPNTNVRHASFDLAKTEAERLARAIPGTRFFVLGCEGFAVKRDVDWYVPRNNEIGDEEIPF